MTTLMTPTAPRPMLHPQPTYAHLGRAHQAIAEHRAELATRRHRGRVRRHLRRP